MSVGATGAALVVAWTPEANLARVVAGLVLFVPLPGIALRHALLPETLRLRSWEGWTISGGLGAAASSLGCAAVVVLSIPLSATVVAVACATITIAASVLALGTRRSGTSSWTGVSLRIAGIIAVTVIAAFLGAMPGTFQARDSFTVFALSSPADASRALTATSSTERRVEVFVESHEQTVRDFEIRVNGVGAVPNFTLRPGESRVIQLDLPVGFHETIDIDLLTDGRPYRSLGLKASAPASRP